MLNFDPKSPEELRKHKVTEGELILIALRRILVNQQTILLGEDGSRQYTDTGFVVKRIEDFFTQGH
jgi:hypothetical protein